MHITPLAWVGIIFILLVLVILNFGLVALMRNKSAFKIKRPPRTVTGQTVQKLGEVLRDPFGEERKQMDELSHLVEQLKENPTESKKGDEQQ